jgi:hypothetical protein
MVGCMLEVSTQSGLKDIEPYKSDSASARVRSMWPNDSTTGRKSVSLFLRVRRFDSHQNFISSVGHLECCGTSSVLPNFFENVMSPMVFTVMVMPYAQSVTRLKKGWPPLS